MTDIEKLIELLDEASFMLKELCGGYNDGTGNEVRAGHLIANGVTVRESGRWEQVDHDGSWRVDRCSICHRRMHYVDYDQPYQYCPNCGADMRPEGEGEEDA